MLGLLTYYACNAKNRPRPPMTNNSFILKTRLRAVSLLLWNSTGTNTKKSGCNRRAVSSQAAISFRCDWRPCCSQIAASPLIARRSRPLFPRSFQSDFTAKETARSLFENKNLLKNLSSQIFQLSTIFYNNLLSLAWKKLGSYKRVFTVYASESKIEKNTKLHQCCTKVTGTVPFRGRGVLP